MRRDYKTIDTTDVKTREKEIKRLKKRLKIVMSCVIFLPLIFLLIIVFLLDVKTPQSVYVGMIVFYILLFIVMIIISMMIPHT